MPLSNSALSYAPLVEEKNQPTTPSPQLAPDSSALPKYDVLGEAMNAFALKHIKELEAGRIPLSKSQEIEGCWSNFTKAVQNDLEAPKYNLAEKDKRLYTKLGRIREEIYKSLGLSLTSEVTLADFLQLFENNIKDTRYHQKLHSYLRYFVKYLKEGMKGEEHKNYADALNASAELSKWCDNYQVEASQLVQTVFNTPENEAFQKLLKTNEGYGRSFILEDEPWRRYDWEYLCNPFSLTHLAVSSDDSKYSLYYLPAPDDVFKNPRLRKLYLEVNQQMDDCFRALRLNDADLATIFAGARDFNFRCQDGSYAFPFFTYPIDDYSDFDAWDLAKLIDERRNFLWYVDKMKDCCLDPNFKPSGEHEPIDNALCDRVSNGLELSRTKNLFSAAGFPEPYCSIKFHLRGTNWQARNMGRCSLNWKETLRCIWYGIRIGLIASLLTPFVGIPLGVLSAFDKARDILGEKFAHDKLAPYWAGKVTDMERKRVANEVISNESVKTLAPLNASGVKRQPLLPPPVKGESGQEGDGIKIPENGLLTPRTPRGSSIAGKLAAEQQALSAGRALSPRSR